MPARHRAMMICAITFLLLGACDRAPTPSTQQPTPVAVTNTAEEQCDPLALVPVSTEEIKPLGELTLTSIDETYTLDVTMNPDPIKLNELFSLRVKLDDDRCVSIDVDAAMPQHGHGMSVRPRVTELSDSCGRFNIEGMMVHMPGQWKIYIDITEGAITERASFDIEVH